LIGRINVCMATTAVTKASVIEREAVEPEPDVGKGSGEREPDRPSEPRGPGLSGNSENRGSSRRWSRKKKTSAEAGENTPPPKTSRHVSPLLVMTYSRDDSRSWGHPLVIIVQNG
jgi:hypothetical protein